MDLSIIIVTWNNEKQIERCLNALRAHAGTLKIEVFVIDNASSDATVAIIQTQFPSVTLMVNSKNRGFAAAVNQGFARATGATLLLLNPDTEVLHGSLTTMQQYMVAHPEVGVAGGKVLNRDGTIQPSVRRFPTFLDQAIILLKLHRFFPALIKRYLADEVDYEKEQNVDQVRGAYFFVSRRAATVVGPMDEKNFFIWFEEVDYCKRVRSAGLRVVYYPGAACRHEGGASFAQHLSVRKQRWMNRSMLHYFKKHASAIAYIGLALLAPLSLALAALASFVPKRFKKYQ